MSQINSIIGSLKRLPQMSTFRINFGARERDKKHHTYFMPQLVFRDMVSPIMPIRGNVDGVGAQGLCSDTRKGAPWLEKEEKLGERRRQSLISRREIVPLPFRRLSNGRSQLSARSGVPLYEMLSRKFEVSARHPLKGNTREVVPVIPPKHRRSEWNLPSRGRISVDVS